MQRLIHFSDISADLKHKSRRMRTKAEGDEAVLDAFPAATILRYAPLAPNRRVFTAQRARDGRSCATCFA